MSAETKTCFRIFTISDYEKEEIWLREMCKKGWMVKKYRIPGIYTFEKCEPQDMIFKLEFSEIPLEVDQEYLAMLKDYGWSYLFSCNNFRYFCKPAEADERNNELFTDDESKLAMVRKIAWRRLLPVTVIFLCCVMPNSIRIFFAEERWNGWSIFWLLMILLYVWLIGHVAAGFYRLSRKYR